MSAADDKAAPAGWTRIRRSLRISLWCLPILFFATLTGLITVLELPIRLLVGWAVHLWAAVPSLLPQWQEVLLPSGCLVLSVVLGHRFVRWVLAIKGSERRWQVRQTMAVFGLLLLGSGAAIAMSGIVHQLAWLSKEPLMESNRPSLRMKALIQIRELLQVVEEFRKQHDRYPESLAELGSFDPGVEKLTWMVTGNGKAPERVIYLKPASIPLEEPALVFASPVMGKPGHVVIGFSDLSVTPMVPVKVEEILNQRLGNEH